MTQSTHSAGDFGAFKIINVLDDKDSVVGTITYADWSRVCNIVSSLDEVPEFNIMSYPNSAANNLFIKGTSGRNDIEITNSKDNTIDMGAGDDYFREDGDQYESINCGAGNDTVFLWFGKRITVDGGDGNDFVENTADNLTFNGGKGDDTLHGAYKALIIYANGDGNDYITGFGSGFETFNQRRHVFYANKR